MKLLHAAISAGKPWASERRLQYLMNARRLDLETSGVLLLARSKPVLVELANLFGSDKPVEQYLALSRGHSGPDEFEMDVRLAPHPHDPARMRVDPKRGKRSQTRVRVIERFKGFTLLRCQPLTGRTHQIRVHLRHAGLPIAGDSMYGGPPLFLSSLKPNYQKKKEQPERPLIARVALHAESLRLKHPVTGTDLNISAPWPKDLTVAVKYLRRFAKETSTA
jgi:RluA family pseudouridine synthase